MSIVAGGKLAGLRQGPWSRKRTLDEPLVEVDQAKPKRSQFSIILVPKALVEVTDRQLSDRRLRRSQVAKKRLGEGSPEATVQFAAPCN